MEEIRARVQTQNGEQILPIEVNKPYFETGEALAIAAMLGGAAPETITVSLLQDKRWHELMQVENLPSLFEVQHTSHK